MRGRRHKCPLCDNLSFSRIGLFSHLSWKHFRKYTITSGIVLFLLGILFNVLIVATTEQIQSFWNEKILGRESKVEIFLLRTYWGSAQGINRLETSQIIYSSEQREEKIYEFIAFYIQNISNESINSFNSMKNKVVFDSNFLRDCFDCVQYGVWIKNEGNTVIRSLFIDIESDIKFVDVKSDSKINFKKTDFEPYLGGSLSLNIPLLEKNESVYLRIDAKKLTDNFNFKPNIESFKISPMDLVIGTLPKNRILKINDIEVYVPLNKGKLMTYNKTKRSWEESPCGSIIYPI